MDLSRLRAEYESIGLGRSDLAPTWHEQLERWVQAAVEAELPEPNAMVLATGGSQIATRIVLLRALTESGLVWFTNYESDKAMAIEADDRVSVTFPWVGLLRQVHVFGTAEKLRDDESDAYFATRPRGSQLGAWASDQSRPVADRATIERRFREMEERFEGGVVPRPAHWGGYRLAPSVVEFWQGRESRLHDRLEFVVDDAGDWSVVRLFP